jgi:hypothetical protein
MATGLFLFFWVPRAIVACRSQVGGPGSFNRTPRPPSSLRARKSFDGEVIDYLKLPQKRWMRLQASSRSEVLVA